MTDFNRFNTAKIFDKCNDLLFVFNSRKLIYFNKSAEKVLKIQSDNWKEFFPNDFVLGQLGLFFNSGRLPDKSYTSLFNETKGESDYLEWRFEDLTVKDTERICLAIGSPCLESFDDPNVKDNLFGVGEIPKLKTNKLLFKDKKYITTGDKKEENARLAQLIIENSPAVLFILDPTDDFKITFITDNISVFGYSSASIIKNGTSFLDFLHPEDLSEWIDQRSEGNTDILEFCGEYRFRDAKGAYKWVEDKTRGVYDQEGKIIYHEGMIQDITERKKDRLEIEENKNRYRVLASNIPCTNIFIIDKDLNYIVAEGPNFKFWGLDSTYFEGKKLSDVHTTNLAEIAPIVIRAIRGKQTVEKEFFYMNRVYDLTATPIMKGDEVEYVLGIARDISGEYRIRKDLQKSELKYRSLVEESTEIIFSINAQMELTYISPNVKQFLGYETFEATSGGFTDFLHPEDLDAFGTKEDREEGFFEKHPYVEFRLRHKNGDYRLFSANGKVIKDEKGNFRYYTGIARDISKLKEAKRELYKAKEKAEQALLAKSQFLSVMSHEIRTPMNAVIGLSHLLIEGNPREDQLENLKTLQFSAENLLGLINDILDFSKMDSGKIELEKVNFNFENILHRIIHSYAYQIREKSLKVMVEIDPDLPKQALGDPVRLGQIINNLMSNAIKFTNSGFVRIGLQLMNQTRKNLMVKFVIEDTGIGIADDKKDSIFDAFTQASTDTSRKYGGTGLGLAIVKKLVELFKSDIEVKSKKEGGSIFEFDIVFEQASKKDLTSSGRSLYFTKSLKNINILVAEDNAVNQIMLKKFLEKWEVGQLEFANNGVEAIEIYLKKKFDLLLLDLQMPEKDGFEVAQYIRNLTDENKKNIPIIALSASSFLEVKDRMEEVGINDYISKPFIPDDLFGKLIKHLK